jgi:hypothetical protein
MRRLESLPPLRATLVDPTGSAVALPSELGGSFKRGTAAAAAAGYER